MLATATNATGLTFGTLSFSDWIFCDQGFCKVTGATSCTSTVSYAMFLGAAGLTFNAIATFIAIAMLMYGAAVNRQREEARAEERGAFEQKEMASRGRIEGEEEVTRPTFQPLSHRYHSARSGPVPPNRSSPPSSNRAPVPPKRTVEDTPAAAGVARGREGDQSAAGAPRALPADTSATQPPTRVVYREMGTTPREQTPPLRPPVMSAQTSPRTQTPVAIVEAGPPAMLSPRREDVTYTPHLDRQGRSRFMKTDAQEVLRSMHWTFQPGRDAAVAPTPTAPASYLRRNLVSNAAPVRVAQYDDSEDSPSPNRPAVRATPLRRGQPPGPPPSGRNDGLVVTPVNRSALPPPSGASRHHQREEQEGPAPSLYLNEKTELFFDPKSHYYFDARKRVWLCDRDAAWTALDRDADLAARYSLAVPT